MEMRISSRSGFSTVILRLFCAIAVEEIENEIISAAADTNIFLKLIIGYLQ